MTSKCGLGDRPIVPVYHGQALCFSEDNRDSVHQKSISHQENKKRNEGRKLVCVRDRGREREKMRGRESEGERKSVGV